MSNGLLYVIIRASCFFFDLTTSLRQVFQPKASFLVQNFLIARFVDLTMIVFYLKNRNFDPF